MTGMLQPFYPHKLKSASYEAGIKGRCISWTADGQQHEVDLAVGGAEFVLEANSIAFVEVEPTFRLPDYMAIRFNLKITHVHRGILLGTGPLVDPGFVGRLLIPLHNLTTNRYHFRCGEGLIWIEFTKTSALPPAHRVPLDEELAQHGQFQSFPQEKHNLPPEEYLRRASPHSPIRSSIPQALQEGQQAAVRAAAGARATARSVRRMRRWFFGVSLLGVAGLLIALAAAVVPTWSLVSDAVNIVNDAQTQLRADLQRDLHRETELQDLRSHVQTLTTRVDQLSREVASSRAAKPPKN